MTTLTLSTSASQATLTPEGANLLSLRIGDREIMWEGTAPWPNRGGFNIAFPFFSQPAARFTHNGQTYPIGKHGFCRKAFFDIIQQTANRATFRLTDNEATRAVYPFSFDLRLSFLLTETHLQADYDLINTGDEELFYALASHPGFALAPHDESNPYKIRFSAPENHPVYMPDTTGIMRVIKDSPIKNSLLPLTSALFAEDGVFLSKDAPDNGFDSTEVALIRPDETTAFRLVLKGFKGLGIWSKPDRTDPAHPCLRYVCLEPVSGLVPRSLPFDQLPDGGLDKIPCLLRLAPRASSHASTTLFW